jgi:hypothetical protein
VPEEEIIDAQEEKAMTAPTHPCQQIGTNE